MRTSFRWRFLKPSLPLNCESNIPVLTLGSKYGRKTIADPGAIDFDFVVISAGIGEDISFDIEFKNKFGNCKYYLVDPSTPAIKHVQNVFSSLGQPKTTAYNNTSRQQISSYDLSKIFPQDLIFYPFALWKNNGFVSFYPPVDDSRDSSGSINAIQNFYVKEQAPLIVQTITIATLLEKESLKKVDILKLDIEGAPLEVIAQMFEDNVFPSQIVVEFDEMHFPSLRSKFRAQKLYRLIMRNGYRLVAIDSCDFTFLQESLFGDR